MLQFFRTYQKYFFFIIATVVISSFIFFGTFGTLDQRQTRKDKIIGKAIDGSDMSLLEISGLSRFLAADRDDLSNGGKQLSPNLLNDGVIRNNFLATGVAEILVRDNFEALKEDFEQRIHRIKNFRAYEHPDAPFVSAKAVWQRFAPDINREWSLLQSLEGVDADSFGHLARLYHFQSALPSEWLRRILMMHEQQYNQWLRPDPRLRQDDLALFGFHSIRDWFGNDFIDLVAEFVHNAAIEAETKGYDVSLDEAKADLQHNFAESMQKIQSAKIPLQITYKEQLRILGLDETEAASLWRKVLLFRRYFTDRGNSVFLDKLPYSEFAAIAKEQATVDLYQWPNGLKIRNALDLFTFQTYLKAVAPQEKSDPLALPSTFYSLKEIEERYPELVATRYKAKVFAVDKREASLKASLKELWAFETEEETWKSLIKEFSFLQSFSTDRSEARFSTLEKLDPVQRAKVDLFARRLLVDRHPEWIEETLKSSEGEEKELILSAGCIELPHIDNPERLGSLFKQIPSTPETALMELNWFESGEAVFRFENIEKITDPKIKTYEEALKDKSLIRIADRSLKAEFPKFRQKLPEELAGKELADVKEEIAELMLIDLKKVIQDSTSDIQEESHFASRRLAAIALRAREDLVENSQNLHWIQTEGEDPLIAQFKLQRIEKQVNRTAEETWMSKEPFFLIPNQWSPIHIDIDGGVSFIYLKNRQTSREPILEQLSVGKEMLASDVQRLLAEKLLATMRKKQSVVIPLQTEEE